MYIIPVFKQFLRCNFTGNKCGLYQNGESRMFWFELILIKLVIFVYELKTFIQKKSQFYMRAPLANKNLILVLMRICKLIK